MPGWCNGSAGQVYLWAQAFRVFGDEQYLELAEKSAWNAWEESYTIDGLCCGRSGATYTMAHLHQLTGERGWWDKARDFAGRAIGSAKVSPFTESLYKGTVGVALSAADLLRPHTASMPVFELEGGRGATPTPT
jgi:serine/threonine-protein kinase